MATDRRCTYCRKYGNPTSGPDAIKPPAKPKGR